MLAWCGSLDAVKKNDQERLMTEMDGEKKSWNPIKPARLDDDDDDDERHTHT